MRANYSPETLLSLEMLTRGVTEREKSFVDRLCKQGTKLYKRMIDRERSQALFEGHQAQVSALDEPVDARTASNCVRMLLSREYNYSLKEDGAREIDEEKVLECGRIHSLGRGSSYLVHKFLGKGAFGKTSWGFLTSLQSSLSEFCHRERFF